MNELKAIEFREVSKYYGKVLALDNVTFEIPLNSRFALLGPNGAGKTTTLKLIAGLLRPNQGYIKIMGYEPETIEAKRLLGYLPEDAQPYRTLSVRENLEYIGALRNVENLDDRIDELLDLLSLREYEKAKVGRLSRGNVQKLAIALAIIHKPKILLLDEPLNYLDIPTQEIVIKILNSMNSTMLVSTHIMSIASRLTENVLMIAKGKLIWSGKINDLRKLGNEDEPLETIVSRMMKS
jgi:ABC-2 type transport system ATP-binding protein